LRGEGDASTEVELHLPLALLRKAGDPGIKARLVQVGAVPLVSTPSELGTLIARDTAKWAN